MFHPLFGNIDNRIVVAINSCHCPFMDNVILITTDFWFFAAVICFLFAYSFHAGNYRRALLFCTLLIAATGYTDFLCAGVIRPLVQQLRPTNPENPVHVMLHIVHGYTGGKYGFPSCHAANSFAIAIFSSLWFRKKWLAFLLILWALSECYTRLYLGVHYPSDIIFGIMAGSIMAWAVYRLSRKLIASIR